MKLAKKGQIFGKHRFWSEWRQAGSLDYFTTWRVATGSVEMLPPDLQSPLDAQESNGASASSLCH
jgi:hypothetical protein